MRSVRHYILGIALTAVITQAAEAQLDTAQRLSSPIGEAKLRTSYSFTGYLKESVAEQDARMQMSQHDFRLSFPLRQSERHEWTLGTTFSALDVDSSARLPDTLNRFPAQLWDLRLSTMYRHSFENGWTGGASFTVGSPSDRPFASGEEILVGASGFLRVPHGERNAWFLLFNYANNRDFLPNVPIPGIAYQYKPSERFVLFAGIPIASARWKPIEKVTLEAMYLIPRTVHARIDYEPLDSLHLYAGFGWTNRRFFRHDRRNDDDRLFYFEKRVALGARWDIRDDIRLDLMGGWAFDRFWFEGEDYGDRGENRLDLSDGPVIQLQLALSL